MLMKSITRIMGFTYTCFIPLLLLKHYFSSFTNDLIIVDPNISVNY